VGVSRHVWFCSCKIRALSVTRPGTVIAAKVKVVQGRYAKEMDLRAKGLCKQIHAMSQRAGNLNDVRGLCPNKDECLRTNNSAGS